MSQIDTSQWKDIPLNQLFNVARSKSIDKRYLSFVDKNTNTIEFIGRTSINNGIQGYILKDSVNFEPNPSNSLSIIQIGHNWATWHDKPWYAAQNIFCLIPKKDQVYEHNVHMFLQSVINIKLQQYQGFTTYPKVTDIKKMTLKLPVDTNGDPDWQYMDTYIAKLTTLAHENVSSLKQAKAKTAKLNIDHWGEFKVSDWFDIRPSNYTKKNGKALKNAELFDGGNNPVIVNSNTNNGIGGYTSNPLTEQGNVITYSDTTDGANTIFYQVKPFVGYSHVKVMLPKLKLSSATMIYLTSIIISAIKNQKYDFSYKLTTDKMLNTIIKLPIDANGEPDWKYMDNQVRHLATLSDLTITSLRSVI